MCEYGANATLEQVTKAERLKAMKVLEVAKKMNKPIKYIPMGYSFEIEKIKKQEQKRKETIERTQKRIKETQKYKGKYYNRYDVFAKTSKQSEEETDKAEE